MDEHASSFGAVAAAYADHRSGYPETAVRWALGSAAGSRVVDLGAGKLEYLASIDDVDRVITMLVGDTQRMAGRRP